MVSKNLLFLLFLSSCVAGHLYCSQVGDQPIELAHELQQVKPDGLAGPAMLPGAAQEAQPEEHVPLYQKAAYAFKSGLNLCRQYPVTMGLMAANIGVFAAQKVVASKVGSDLILVRLSQANKELEEGKLWRLVTACFVHKDWSHLIVNSLALLKNAPLEKLLGSKKFFSFYMTSGISSGLANFFVNKCYGPQKYDRLTCGASGAIWGLDGVQLAKEFRYFQTLFRHISEKKRLVVDRLTVFKNTVFLYEISKDFYSLMHEYAGGPRDSICHAAHIGGFASGLVLGRVFSD